MNNFKSRNKQLYLSLKNHFIMKNFIYTLILALVFSSCSSVNKLVEKGKYDKAIELAVKKLRGKKKKKTKYVKGLETAFKKMMIRDMAHVDRLIEKDNPKYWDEIFETYRNINRRQEIIQPLLPLVSEDGYRAKFKFLKTGSLEKGAAEKAGLFYYNKAQADLEMARKGNKISAKNAYISLENIGKYYDNYKDVDELLEEAYNLGQTRILVQMHNRTVSILPIRFEDKLFSFGVRNLDTKWNKFYNDRNANIEFDVIANYNIDIIDASPEREIVTKEVETKEVKDGWKYQYDHNGNVMKDSLGNDIKLDKYIVIRADVAHVIMEKFVGIDGNLQVKDLNNGKILLNKTLSGEAVFDEHFSRFNGDKDALSKKTKRNLKHGTVYFPSDEEMLLQTADGLKDELSRELRKLFR